MAALEKCRHCHRLVRWVETTSGARLPVDPDPDPTGTVVIGYDGRARYLVRRERQCRVCGCVEAAACIVDGYPCSWIERDLCSGCAGKTQRRLVPHVITCPDGASAGRAAEAAAAVRRATDLAIEEGRTAAEGLPAPPPRLPAAFPEWRPSRRRP